MWETAVPGLWDESKVRLLLAEGRERVGIRNVEREMMPPGGGWVLVIIVLGVGLKEKYREIWDIYLTAFRYW